MIMDQRNVKTIKTLFFIFSISFLELNLTSCHHSKNNNNIFHYNEATGIPTLDPAFAKNQSIMWAVHQIYNTLVEVDSNLNIKPSLAKSWDVSEDNLTFTFHLRTDVQFQNSPVFFNNIGRKLNAGDVAYSLRRITDPSTASSGAWIFNDKVNIKNGFNVINDSTFQLNLIKPFQPILGILSMQYCSVIPKEAVDKYGKDFRSHPCGTGPFQLLAWDEGQTMILIKNKQYFEKDRSGVRLPYLDGIRITFLDNKATEFLQFQQHRLDFIKDIDPSFKDELLSKKGELRKQWKDKIKLIKQPFLNIEYLGILQDSANDLVKNSFLKNKKVRQAINYAIDRKKMILYLRNSLGIPAESGFVPAGLPSFDTSKVKGYTFDPSRSLQLLREAKFPTGEESPIIKMITIPLYADLGSFIANELLQVGIKVQVEIVQKSLLIEQTSKSEALFFRGSWIADYPDAENYLSVFYSRNPAPPNYTRYKNKAFDKLYEAALIEKNDMNRMKLYQEADQLVINDSPVIPLWYDMVVRMIQPEVLNFKANSLDLLELRIVKLNR